MNNLINIENDGSIYPTYSGSYHLIVYDLKYNTKIECTIIIIIPEFIIIKINNNIIDSRNPNLNIIKINPEKELSLIIDIYDTSKMDKLENNNLINSSKTYVYELLNPKMDLIKIDKINILNNIINGPYQIIVTNNTNSRIKCLVLIEYFTIPKVLLNLIVIPLKKKIKNNISQNAEIIDNGDEIIIQYVDKNIIEAVITDLIDDYEYYWILPDKKKINSLTTEILNDGKYQFNITSNNDIISSKFINVVINRDEFIIMNINNKNYSCGEIVNITSPEINILASIKINYLTNEKINYELLLNDEPIDYGSFNLIDSMAIIDFGIYTIINNNAEIKLLLSMDELIDICFIFINKINLKNKNNKRKIYC